MAPALMVTVPGDGVFRFHWRKKVCRCSAGFVATHVNENGSATPDRGEREVAPGARVKVPPTDASRTRSLTFAPVKVPLTCTAKFCASVDVIDIPGTPAARLTMLEPGHTVEKAFVTDR